MTNNEILESINDIDSVVLESEMNVIESLIDSYSKSAMILENYEGDNLDSFELFSESFIMEADDNASTEPKESRFRNLTKDGKKENILKSILMLIPRLLKWLAQSIKKVWDKRPATKLKREVADLEKRLNNSETDLLKEIDRVSDRCHGNINDIRAKIVSLDNRHMNDVTSLSKQLNDTTKHAYDIENNVSSLKKSQKIMSDDIRSLHDTQDEQSRETAYLDNRIANNEDNIKALRMDTTKDKFAIDKRLTQAEQATSAYILAKEKKISSPIDFKKSIEICKKYVKFVDQITSATMFKPSSVNNIDAHLPYEIDIGYITNDKDTPLDRMDWGRKLYPFDEFVKNCELLQNMCTGLAEKCRNAVPIVEKRLKDFNESIEAKGKKIDSNHQMKLDAANKQIKLIKNTINACVFYTSDMSSRIDDSAKYIKMYKNLYSMFAAGNRPTENHLWLNTRSEYDEVKAPFNKKN